MKKILVAVMVCVLVVGFASSDAKAQKGTRDEAVAMVKKAVATYKAEGRMEAFEKINDPKGQFVKGDLYIWVIDTDANALCLARPVFKQLIGIELIDFQDLEGRYFMREAVSTAKAKGKGWVDYTWANPITKKQESKSTYFECVKNLCFFCGYYK